MNWTEWVKKGDNRVEAITNLWTECKMKTKNMMEREALS